jgi:hypothetical protein
VPPVVLAAAEIRDNPSKLAACGKPFLPELLILRELLDLASVPGLKQVRQD